MTGPESELCPSLPLSRHKWKSNFWLPFKWFFSPWQVSIRNSRHVPVPPAQINQKLDWGEIYTIKEVFIQQNVHTATCSIYNATVNRGCTKCQEQKYRLHVHCLCWEVITDTSYSAGLWLVFTLFIAISDKSLNNKSKPFKPWYQWHFLIMIFNHALFGISVSYDHYDMLVMTALHGSIGLYGLVVGITIK